MNIDTATASEQDAAEEDDRYAYLNDTMITIPAGHKLQYLFTANRGLTGFYNDSTVAECPRCDLTVEAIEFLNKRNTHGTYQIGGNALMITYSDRTTSKMILEDDDEVMGWAMIDYKWRKKVPNGGE